MTNMNEIIQAADYASQKSDRWLFIVMLVILLIFAVFVWRWLISDREKIGKRLTEVTDRHITVTEKLSEVVANNTAVLQEVRKKL
jgi:HAMP domain-containing protein